MGGFSGSSPSGQAATRLVASRVDPGRVIAFLDFDGVISTFRAMHARGEWIDPIACEMLAKLQAKHGFQIVISSSWRGMEKRCRDALTPSGLCEHLHSDWRTNDSPGGRRGEEIDDWLRRHGEPEFIIFDDETFDFGGRHISRLIQCDMMDGILHRHFVAADKLLTRLCDSGRQPKAEDPKGLSGEAMPERRPEEAASPETLNSPPLHSEAGNQ